MIQKSFYIYLPIYPKFWPSNKCRVQTTQVSCGIDLEQYRQVLVSIIHIFLYCTQVNTSDHAMPIVNDLVPYILSHNDKIDFYKSNMKTFLGRISGLCSTINRQKLILVEYQSKQVGIVRGGGTIFMQKTGRTGRKFLIYKL